MKNLIVFVHSIKMEKKSSSFFFFFSCALFTKNTPTLDLKKCLKISGGKTKDNINVPTMFG